MNEPTTLILIGPNDEPTRPRPVPTLTVPEGIGQANWRAFFDSVNAAHAVMLQRRAEREQADIINDNDISGDQTKKAA